jgi:hypothetical protein
MGDKLGGSLSVTVTVKEQRWPDAEVTITLVEPILKKEPEAGAYLIEPEPPVAFAKFT